MTLLLDVLKQAVIVGDADRAAELAERCLAEGMPAQTLFEQGIVAGIQETGRLWDANHYYVPDVILSADAFRQTTRVVERQMGQRRAGCRGKVVIGVVEGDVHDLGKGIVVAMLLGAGFEVVDLGVDLPAERFVEAVRTERPDILGIGAYMSTTMLLVHDVLEVLEEAGLRQTVRVMVGGVPTTQHFADDIGADGWALDASGAARKAQELMERR